ncbi:S-layer protein domain-containing protein [Methanolobus mangrovi]|uniref:S-layer protein domain-containing protein n=1 Tax=Methanolobus mangrovi TaxID=3072977 RepID=A0AA51UFJ5_9EURY|nr:S-layer protein domain-containing protein [Methanolobus mangrovi]WMW22243.1 S-layer protein domain-containing protein [Methanolobus mangrovi]
MKKMTGLIIAFSAILIMTMMLVSASDVTYKIRSSVYDNSDVSTPTGDFYWDANSFSGFWFPIKPGLSSEVLYFHNSVNSSSTIQLGDKIAEGNLYYVSKPQMKKTKIGACDDGGAYVVDGIDLKKYYLMGFFGSQHVVMPEESSDLSAGCKPDRIAKILLETDDDVKKQMFSGEEWELAGGWSLIVQQVDVEGSKVWVQLNKDGEGIDSSIVSGDMDLAKQERTYLYKDADDYPVFYCYVDSIFRGMDTDFVVFKYAFLRGDIITIEDGDSYGAFDVEGFEVPAVMGGIDYAGSGSGTVLHTGDDVLLMSNNDDITLNPNKIIDLYGGLYLKTEDTSAPCLKMTLWKTCTITVPGAVQEDENEDAGEEVIVVDLAEGGNEAQTSSSTMDESAVSYDVDNADGDVVQSSVVAPGFELFISLVGLFGASRVRG